MPRRTDDSDWYDPGRKERRRQAREERKKRTLYILLAAAAVTVVTCGGIATFVVVQARRTVRDFQQVMKPFEPGPPVARVSAEDLFQAYRRNDVDATQKYGFESIQVDGVVATVEKQSDGGYLVTFQTGAGQARVHAEFEVGQSARKLQVGQTCSVIGFCNGRVDNEDAFIDRPPPRDGPKWVVVLSECRLAD